MKKYMLLIIAIFTFVSLMSACTEDIILPEPEGPHIPEVPIPDADTLNQPPIEEPTEDPAEDPTEDPTEEPAEDPSDNPTDPMPDNGSVPAGLDGNWVQGTFSLTNFWAYDGSYAGNASEQSNVFVFKPNGEYEQYFVMVQRMYNCKTEAYTYKKGTVTFNEADGSFTVTPSSGNYRGFYSCASGSNFNRSAKPEELVPQTFYYKMEQINGKPYMVVRHNRNDANGSNFQKTVW
jgi:hypothetical protein